MNAEAARLAILCMIAGEAGPAQVMPALDSRLTTEWKLAGWIVGTDALLRTGRIQPLAARVFYGWVLESLANAGSFVAVLRGTAGAVEWIEDAEFVPLPYPLGGTVEAGFYGVYGSLSLRIPGGTEYPLVKGLRALLAPTDTLTVTGHSLGAAIATYATLEVRFAMDNALRGRYFASPHTGDSAFIATFDQHITDYAHFAYELDLVPRVPFGLGYVPLTKTTIITPATAAARIKLNLDCCHHAWSYAAMLDKTSVIPSPFQACMIG